MGLDGSSKFTLGLRQRDKGSGTGCFLLTGDADQDHPQQQVDQPAPALRHTGNQWWDDDLSGDVELHSVGEENPKGEEQLDSLVQPANEKERTVRCVPVPVQELDSMVLVGSLQPGRYNDSKSIKQSRSTLPTRTSASQLFFFWHSKS